MKKGNFKTQRAQRRRGKPSDTEMLDWVALYVTVVETVPDKGKRRGVGVFYDDDDSGNSGSFTRYDEDLRVAFRRAVAACMAEFATQFADGSEVAE